MQITLELLHTWDARARQTGHLLPRRSAAFLLDWTIEPHPIDAIVPPEIALPIADGLSRCGDVVFRMFDAGATQTPGLRFMPAPPRTLVTRIADWMAGAWPADLAIATGPAAAAQMFAQGWDMQSQAALVFAPDSLPPAVPAVREADSLRPAVPAVRDADSLPPAAPAVRDADATGPALAALRTTRDWRAYGLAPPVLALAAPATDGWGMLVAAETPNRLEQLAASLRQCFAQVGISVA